MFAFNDYVRLQVFLTNQCSLGVVNALLQDFSYVDFVERTDLPHANVVPPLDEIIPKPHQVAKLDSGLLCIVERLCVAHLECFLVALDGLLLVRDCLHSFFQD